MDAANPSNLLINCSPYIRNLLNTNITCCIIHVLEYTNMEIVVCELMSIANCIMAHHTNKTIIVMKLSTFGSRLSAMKIICDYKCR